MSSFKEGRRVEAYIPKKIYIPSNMGYYWPNAECWLNSFVIVQGVGGLF